MVNGQPGEELGNVDNGAEGVELNAPASTNVPTDADGAVVRDGVKGVADATEAALVPKTQVRFELDAGSGALTRQQERYLKYAALLLNGADMNVETPLTSDYKGALSAEDQTRVLADLSNSFEKNVHLYEGCEWQQVEDALLANPRALWTVCRLQAEGHEPGVIEYNDGGVVIGSLCKETPAGTRMLIYDGLSMFSINSPHDSALEAATRIDAVLINREQYGILQQMGEFDVAGETHLLTENIDKLANGRSDRGCRGREGGAKVLTLPYHEASSHLGARFTLTVPWATTEVGQQ